jgi:hypothetical protein
MNDVVSYNPFQSAPAVAVPSNSISVSGQAEVQRAIAEVQAAILLAKQFPRDRMRAYDEIMTECCREGLAAHAIYCYSKGGSEVTGPSIGLAEAIALCWGNIQYGWNELNRQGGASEIEAWSWDTERNLRRSIKFYVKHIRNTKRGSYAIEDEREIYELCANQASRRLRACLLKIIPGDVIDDAVKQCETTLATKVSITPERINNMVKLFEEYGVTKEMLEKRVQRRIDTITGPHMVQLTKIYNSLKDGMSSANEWFETDLVKKAAEQPSNASEAIKQKLREKQKNDSTIEESSIVEPEIAKPVIPLTEDKSGSDWAAYANTLKSQINLAPSIDWLMRLRKSNETQINRLKDNAPDIYSDVMSLMMGKEKGLKS